jgi:Uma2 family endonuclease
MMISLKLDPKTIKIRSKSGKIFFTYSDIEKLPEWPSGPLLEIIGGELFLVPSPNLDHQRISRRLTSIIIQYVEKHKIGEIFYAPVDVVFSDENVLVPDLIFISREHINILHPNRIQGAPDLVIEILSENKEADLVHKKEIYEKYGVREYWIIDPKSREIMKYVSEKNSKQFTVVQVFHKQDTMQFSTIPGLEILVEDIFKDI